MTEFKMAPDRDNIAEYVKISVYGKGPQKMLMIALYVSTALIAALGIIMTVMTGQPIMLLITGIGIIAGISYPIMVRVFTNSAINKTVASMAKNNDISMAVSEMNIIMIKNGVPTGIIEWDKFSEIVEGKTGFFLKTSDDTLLLLAKSNVSSGTYDEAVQILNAKAAAIKPEEKTEK